MIDAGPLHPTVAATVARLGLPYRAVACDPELADTADFCQRYGYPLGQSANTLLVVAKTGGTRYAACVLLATCRLDVNRTVRKRLGARRISFAPADDTRRLTGMELGGVTPLALPDDLPLWVDARVMEVDEVILGGGNRSSKLIITPRVFAGMANAEVVPDLAFPAPEQIAERK